MSHSTGSNVVFLQNALKNLEERYKKLQSRTDSLQTENERLVASRTELVNEVERLQDQQIRLRERNLRLTQEFHAKQQECSLLAEKLTMFARGRVGNYRENTEISKSNSSELKENQESSKDSVVTVELHGSVITSPSTLKILEAASRTYSEPNLSIIQRELDLVRKGLWSPAFENAKLAAVEECCSKSHTTHSRNPSPVDCQFPDKLKANLKPLEAVGPDLSNLSDKTDLSSLDPVDRLNNCVLVSNMILNNLKGQNSRLLKVQQILKMAAGKCFTLVFLCVNIL